MKNIVIIAFALIISINAACSTSDLPLFTGEDLQSLIDQSVPGQVLEIPAGIYTVSQSINIVSPLILRGQGSNTIIRNLKSAWNESAILIRISTPSYWRITSLTFEGSGTGHENAIMIQGNSNFFRIDHCTFRSGGAHSVMLDANITGVIDHCVFEDDSQESISIRNGTGNEVWALGAPLGTSNAIFIEDCYFHFQTKGDHAVTSVNGGRYVFRYNTISSASARNSTQIDTHGNFFNDRGGFSSEIYENTLISGSSYYGMYIRGGSGVIFNNTLSGKFTLPICFANYRSFDTPVGELPGPCGFSACTYPAPDQINNFYIWNNSYTNGEARVSVQDRGLEQAHIQEGRDYFHSLMPGYSPYTYPHPFTLLTE